ncbi:MAG: ASKHA domain-containing protein [Candidatus Coatesbacteria bacterium]
MRRNARLVLRPIGVEMSVKPGTALADALVVHGVEFPCGGRGRCRGCRVRVVEGSLAESAADRERLSAEELAGGWRLACQARVEGDLVLELRQWSGLILADETSFPFEPSPGLGIAVDIGTTTVVAQLLDLTSGQVLGTRTALNPQARWGADVMSRISAALAPGGPAMLRDAIRTQIASMVNSLLKGAPHAGPLTSAALVGNSAMHHLFLGHDVTPLSRYPFEPEHPEAGWLNGGDLGWTARARDARVLFLPILGGFVGSDILAVILATRIHEATGPTGCTDLGTNGEIVFTAGREIVVASTAAGPAFEGARISCGMRAAPGAIDRVTQDGKTLTTHVIGGGTAQGVCGSGLVDAVAAGLDLGLIQPSGRLAKDPLPLRAAVGLRQADIRELQLAKGAIAAGIRILMDEVGLPPGTVCPFYLAGAFGNSLSVAGARRIGLLPFPEGSVKPAGNAALLGAKMVLGMKGLGAAALASLLPRIRHVPLERRPDFQELFAEAMTFPEGSPQ